MSPTPGDVHAHAGADPAVGGVSSVQTTRKGQTRLTVIEPAPGLSCSSARVIRLERIANGQLALEHLPVLQVLRVQHFATRQ